MATTGSSADRTFGPDGRNRAKARNVPRSLGAALREAGLGEAAPDRRRPSEVVRRPEIVKARAIDGSAETFPGNARSAELSSAIAASRSPRLAVFCEREGAAEPLLAEPVPHVVLTSAPAPQGVVSPPPWLRAARRGRWRTRLLNVSDFFSTSSEFKNTYGDIDEAEFVALIYKNVLARTPDGSGFSFWTRQLQSGRYSRAEVMIGFSESQEYKERLEFRI